MIMKSDITCRYQINKAKILCTESHLANLDADGGSRKRTCERKVTNRILTTSLCFFHHCRQDDAATSDPSAASPAPAPDEGRLQGGHGQADGVPARRAGQVST